MAASPGGSPTCGRRDDQLADTRQRLTNLSQEESRGPELAGM